MFEALVSFKAAMPCSTKCAFPHLTLQLLLSAVYKLLHMSPSIVGLFIESGKCNSANKVRTLYMQGKKNCRTTKVLAYQR